MSVEFPVQVSNPGSVSTEAASSGPGPTRGGAFADVLHAIGEEVDRGERLIGGVVKGRASSLSAGDLIALQAGIYRYTELVDLSAKFIDRATTAVRTTLQSGT